MIGSRVRGCDQRIFIRQTDRHERALRESPDQLAARIPFISLVLVHHRREIRPLRGLANLTESVIHIARGIADLHSLLLLSVLVDFDHPHPIFRGFSREKSAPRQRLTRMIGVAIWSHILPKLFLVRTEPDNSGFLAPNGIAKHHPIVRQHPTVTEFARIGQRPFRCELCVVNGGSATSPARFEKAMLHRLPCGSVGTSQNPKKDGCDNCERLVFVHRRDSLSK